MIGAVKNYLSIISRSVAIRRVIVDVIKRRLIQLEFSGAFKKRFGFYPVGLESNALPILSIARTARIGSNNKIIISNSGMRFGNRESTISLGENCWTGTQVELNVMEGCQIRIKDYTTVQDFCKILGDVTLERYCLIAPSVFISSGRHHFRNDNFDLIRNQDFRVLNSVEELAQHSRPVHIEEDCWIGFSAFIQNGVYIGRGAVIGAHAVVTRDVAPYTIIGQANKIIGMRAPFEPTATIHADVQADKPGFYRGFSHIFISSNQSTAGLRLIDEGVVILKGGDILSFAFSGKHESALRSASISLVYNGKYHKNLRLHGDVNGHFTFTVAREEFSILSNPIEDGVLRMRNVNVFHIKLLDDKSESIDKEHSTWFYSFEVNLL
jgi:acetyltransferase-like isoleucine patch superfamily enzyme